MTLEQQVHALELRVKKLEKHAHPPVTFTEDKDGFLRVVKEVSKSKGGSSNG